MPDPMWRKNNPAEWRVISKRAREKKRALIGDEAYKREAYCRYIRYEYDLACEEYERMLAEQDGKCAICRVSQEGKKLSIDHNHQTGQIRGLLCQKCNIGIGHFDDDITRLLHAVHYLVKERENAGIN